ncbi:thiazole biosynthesis adenylyltransferase ThiF [Virgibacillus xinjiangensis]|uniref:Thiazole biosynthesis adenylyltransferase ThiF n=1 Tax=Virgibacillus xinjiangensis TaxID=393090 RepID=A0ABV7CWW0_9BACI
MDVRYSRQILFSPIGREGQDRLKEKHVLLIGAGALGTSNAEIMVRAGVGKVTIADRDYVEWSNLQRQQLYTEEDAAHEIPKAVAAKKRLESINGEVAINAEILDVTPVEMARLIDGVDLIIDATDNFDIRMIINDTAQKYGVPWIYGAIVGSYGLSYTVIPEETPCLHCLMKRIPMDGATCDTAGVISPIVQLIVAHQSAEALKILTGNHGALRKQLISYDIWSNQQSAIDVGALKEDSCPSCGQAPTYPFLDYESQTKTAVLCGRDTVQIRPASREKRDLQKVASKLSQTAEVRHNEFLLSFKKDPYRFVMFQDGRVLVHGTNDAQHAKTLYHRYLG